MTEQYCTRCNGLGILQKRHSNETMICPDCYGGIYGRDSEDVPNREPEETYTEYQSRMWKWGQLKAEIEREEAEGVDLFADFEEWKAENQIRHDTSDRDDDDDYNLRDPFASLGPYGNLW